MRQPILRHQRATHVTGEPFAFFAVHEFLVRPTVQVLPFPVEVEWPRAIDGVAMQTYIDWMGTCYAISCTGLPASSVPCGFSAEGLPVGLQIVGGPTSCSRSRLRAGDATRS